MLKRRRGALWNVLFVALLGFAVMTVPGHTERFAMPGAAGTDGGIPAGEFARMIQEFSEDDGYFSSDNFTSNETSYLHIVGKLRDIGVSGGAYLGVGPEQNFTYISKIRPRIAFILDVRRQAVIQHLLYKAIFHVAPGRAQFLATLLCRPIQGNAGDLNKVPVAEMLNYFLRAPKDSDAAFARDLARVRKIIQQDFRFPLTEHDQGRLEYVYRAFRSNGLGISFRADGTGWPYGRFPDLEDLVLQPDQEGRLGNFLAADEDYLYVRQLQEQNRVIPVVGDFAGRKALASLGRYLRGNQYKVSAFYTSNVEQFLFRSDTFPAFVSNVRTLPIDDKSVFIRAVARMGRVHPAYQAGHRTTTVLERIADFLNDQANGPYPSYWDLVTSHYIAGDGSR
jgi:hypothetical protein